MRKLFFIQVYCGTAARETLQLRIMWNFLTISSIIKWIVTDNCICRAQTMLRKEKLEQLTNVRRETDEYQKHVIKTEYLLKTRYTL